MGASAPFLFLLKTMGLLNDKQISKLAELDIFQPYVGEKRRTLDDGTKAISYGLSQAGYDIRLSPKHFLVFNDEGLYRNDLLLDPKLSDPTVPYEQVLTHDQGSSFFELPPFSFGLGTSLELITMPADVMGLCDGKSTYARCGVIINVTPIEPGWSGHLTMHIANPSPFPVRIYANEGIVQVMLYKLDSEVEQAYTGHYQNQGATVQLAAV
jgi:dCTP deaminase